MTDEVSTMDDEFIIKRKGRSLAALVPVERLEQMRRFARRRALEFMQQQRPGPLNGRRVDELAAEAKRWARSRASKTRRRT
jgi:hypothetical protein